MQVAIQQAASRSLDQVFLLLHLHQNQAIIDASLFVLLCDTQ